MPPWSDILILHQEERDWQKLLSVICIGGWEDRVKNRIKQIAARGRESVFVQHVEEEPEKGQMPLKASFIIP